MELIDPRLMDQTEREAERMCEVLNELDRLERMTGQPVPASVVANALGWSVVDLAEAVLEEAVEMGCAVVDPPTGGYRLG